MVVMVVVSCLWLLCFLYLVYGCFNLVCNVCVCGCVCVGFVMCGFCNMWVCVYVGFVMCGCVYVWVL